MPDIGTGGGMRLSVGIGLNLTGFEALTQIAKELEVLQQMAMKTEQAFRAMGNTLRQTMNVGTAELGRAADRMERASRSTRVPQGAALGEQYAFGFSGIGPGLRREELTDRRLAQQQSREETSQRTSRQEFLSSAMTPLAGVNQVDPELVAKSRFNAGLEAQKTRAIAASTRAIQEETAARAQGWTNLKTGIMGGIGITAAFEAANVVRMGMHAVGQLDERVAAMRMTGHSEDEIERTKRGAFENPVHGVNAAERMFLGQEMAGILGKAVSDETTKGISILARAVTRITGQGDITSNTRNILRSADSFGNLINESGQLDEGRLLKNAMAVERGIAVTQGFVKAETFMHNSRMAMAPLQALDVANNPHALAQFAVMNEDLGERAGDTLNNMFRESMAGISLSSDKGSMLLKHHLFDLNKIEPLMKLPGGTAKLLSFDALVGEGNFLDKLRNAHDVIATDVKRQHPNATPQQIQQLTLAEETKTFGQRAARGMEDIFSATGGQEKVAKTEERLRRLGATLEEIDTQSQNFNDGLLAVKASFQDLAIALVSVGGVTRMLYGIADALESVAGFVEKHKAIASALGDIAGILATFLALRGAVGGLRMLGGMFVGGAAAGGAAGLAGAEVGGLAGFGVAVESVIMGLSKLNIALLAISALASTFFANKMGQQDLLNFAKSEGFKPSKKDSPEIGFLSALMKPNNGEALDQWFSQTWLGKFFKKIPTFENDQGELRTYGQMTQQKQFEEENKAIIEESKHGKGFPGEEYPSPVAAGTMAGSTTPAAPQHQPNIPRGVTFGRGVMPPTTRSSIPPGMSAAEFFSHTPEWRRQHAVMGAQPPMTPTPGMGSSLQAPTTQAPMATPASVISPTGMNTPTVGASPTIPAPGQQPTQPEMPTMRVSTIETNMLIVRGGGGVQPQVGTNATGGTGAPSNASTTLQSVAPGEPVAGLAGSTPQNQQKGIAQSNTPAALQSVAPGEPVAGLSGAKPVSTGNRMDGHQRHPTGIRGSAGATSQPMSTPFSGSAKQFHDSIYQDIYKAAVKKGLPHPEEIAKIGSAQSSLETGFGKHVVGNNFFGIKAGGGVGQGIVQAGTTENIGGRNVGTTANFASFGNQQQSAEGYVDFLSKNQRYSGLLAASNDQQALTALSGSGYATDPNYGSKVGSIMQNYAAPNIQGPQINPEQADVPASTMHVTVHGHNYLDGEEISDHVMNHMIGGGATASPSTTGYDTKMMPMVPGSSLARW